MFMNNTFYGTTVDDKNLNANTTKTYATQRNTKTKNYNEVLISQITQ